jgi:glycosyltransferase involved in cell wall biosynthesis
LERITKKRILIHSIVFSPDSVSTAYLYNDIALGFKNAGYEVIVLTTTPHYNLIENTLLKQPLKRKLFGLFFVSDYKGIDVIHIPSKKYKSTILRLFSFLYWHFFSLFLALSFKKLDFIISPSPPLTIGFVSILIAKKNRAKFIYNVQEIYPDILIKNGIIKSKIIIKLLKRLERYVYNNASAIITIDQKFYDQIIGRINNTEKLKIIPNFVDTKLYKPLNEELKLPNPFIKDPQKIRLLYAGNIGFYQDWEPILFAAKKLIDTNIEFWIIGEGVKKEYLINEINKNNLINIKVLPYQDRELMPFINSFADIHFISINKEMEQEGFPSKVYTIMASAKPMIILTGKGTPLFNFLKDLNCSILITENKNDNFVNTILELSYDKKIQYELGTNGYNEIHKNYTKKKIINKYIDLFNQFN